MKAERSQRSDRRDPQNSPEFWDQFVSAATAEERCRAWLNLLCEDIAGVQAGAVLVESVEAGTFVPVAVWPAATAEFGRLAGAVEVALRERRSVVRPAAEGSTTKHLAYPLMLDQRIDGVVVLEVNCADDAVEQVMRDIHWGSAWLANLLGARELDEAIRGRDRVASVLEASAVALRQGRLKQVLFEVANDLRQRLRGARAAIGLVNDASVKMAALSEAATFERKTPLVKAYVEAMEEVHDRASVIVASVPADGATAETTARPAPAHRALMAISGSRHVVSQPLQLGPELIGVLSIERQEEAFTDDDLAWLDAYAALAASILDQRRKAEQTSIGRLWSEAKRLLQKLFGPRHLVWKAATSLAVLVLALLVLLPIDYRVAAKTVIEGEVQRVAAAPFEGFIASSQVRAGDTVKAGQVLATLDDRELKIEQARWASERDQYESRLREATATHDLTAVQVLSAQLRQAEAQWSLASEKIERAGIRAPFDGIVVSGDLSQQIGAPVESGKTLFEIAPLQSYRIILQVDEREIRYVAPGQPGRLVMTGIASEPMAFAVAKVTPVATAQEGKNFFRVEAAISGASPRLRPGMEGVGKVEVGERSLWWVLTHSFSDWLTLSLWTWMP